MTCLFAAPGGFALLMRLREACLFGALPLIVHRLARQTDPESLGRLDPLVGPLGCLLLRRAGRLVVDLVT